LIRWLGGLDVQQLRQSGLQREVAERLLPRPRLRAFPRVVKRKMSNSGVKRAHHRAWPRPTLPAAEAVVIVGASKWGTGPPATQDHSQSISHQHQTSPTNLSYRNCL
jgi:hypothetical protein